MFDYYDCQAVTVVVHVVCKQTKGWVATGDADYGGVACLRIRGGGFQLDVGDTFGTSKATACRMVYRVANVLAGKLNRFVKFEHDAERTKGKYFAMAGFPNVIGCIDCTHVRIIGPCINEHEFINRKGVHSINVQI